MVWRKMTDAEQRAHDAAIAAYHKKIIRKQTESPTPPSPAPSGPR